MESNEEVKRFTFESKKDASLWKDGFDVIASRHVEDYYYLSDEEYYGFKGVHFNKAKKSLYEKIMGLLCNLEDYTNYENKDIGEAINILQKVDIEKD